MNKLAMVGGVIVIAILLFSYSAEAWSLWEFLGLADAEEVENTYIFDVKVKIKFTNDSEIEYEYETHISAMNEEDAIERLNEDYNGFLVGDNIDEFELEIELIEEIDNE